MYRKHIGGITSLVLQAVEEVKGVRILDVVADVPVQDFYFDMDTQQAQEDYTAAYARLWQASKEGKSWQN